METYVDDFITEFRRQDSRKEELIEIAISRAMTVDEFREFSLQGLDIMTRNFGRFLPKNKQETMAEYGLILQRQLIWQQMERATLHLHT